MLRWQPRTQRAGPPVASQAGGDPLTACEGVAVVVLLGDVLPVRGSHFWIGVTPSYQEWCTAIADEWNPYPSGCVWAELVTSSLASSRGRRRIQRCLVSRPT
jgi:hypothetical protein